MTPEGKVKKKVTDILKALNIYYFTPVSGGYGKSGVPDIVACCNGRFIGIECKAGQNQPTALQTAQLEAIKRARGLAFVVNEDSLLHLHIQLLLRVKK